jgi:hypothetical protein
MNTSQPSKRRKPSSGPDLERLISLCGVFVGLAGLVVSVALAIFTWNPKSAVWVLVCGGGLFAIVAAALNADFFFERHKAWLVVKLLGRTGARFVYAGLGVFLFLCGIGFLLGGVKEAWREARIANQPDGWKPSIPPPIMRPEVPAKPGRPAELKAEEAKQLIADLKGTNDERRQQALDRLLEADPTHPLRPELAEAVGYASTRIENLSRYRAARVLTRWGTPAQIPVMLELVAKQEPQGNELIDRLVEFGDVRVAEGFVALLQAARRRTELADKLIALGPVAERPVHRLLQHQDAAVRYQGCRVLDRIATPDSTKELIVLVLDKEPAPAEAAMKILGRLRDERAAAPLVEAWLLDNHARVAGETIFQLGPLAEIAMIPVLDAPETRHVSVACRFMKEHGSKRCLPALQALSKSPDAAKAALGKEALMHLNGRGIR